MYRGQSDGTRTGLVGFILFSPNLPGWNLLCTNIFLFFAGRCSAKIGKSFDKQNPIFCFYIGDISVWVTLGNHLIGADF